MQLPQAEFTDKLQGYYKEEEKSLHTGVSISCNFFISQ